MRPTTAHHRLPRAGIDPIDTPHLGLSTVMMAAHRPLRPETVVVLLDDARRGLAIAVVTGTERLTDVIEVVECLTRPVVHAGRSAAVVVGSIRPGTLALDGDDVDRWLELSDIAEQHGVELVEWFVVTGEGGTEAVCCPRDLLGEAPRW